MKSGFVGCCIKRQIFTKFGILKSDVFRYIMRSVNLKIFSDKEVPSS